MPSSVVTKETTETISPIRSLGDPDVDSTNPRTKIRRSLQKINKKGKINKINKIFDDTLYWLEHSVRDGNRVKHGTSTSTNIHGSFNQEAFKWFEVDTEEGSEMFIFTVTKEYYVVCEIFSKQFDINFTENILVLLQITDHIYFHNILEFEGDKFSEVWTDLKNGFLNFNDYGRDYKSITFTPHSSEKKMKGELNK